MTASNDDDRIARAGEYALRVLGPAEESEARAEAARDPAFGAEVDRWNDQLGRMADGIAPVQPSAALWPRILAATGGAANDNAVTFWRRWAIGSTGLLAASLAAVAIMIATPAPAPAPDPATTPVAGAITRVATLKLDNGVTALTLAYDSVTGELYLAPTREMEGDTRIPHLWLVLPDEGGVQLVGAIEGNETSRHNLQGGIVGQATQAIAVAVSMEEPGHTPDAHRPDGPVVAQGEFQAL